MSLRLSTLQVLEGGVQGLGGRNLDVGLDAGRFPSLAGLRVIGPAAREPDAEAVRQRADLAEVSAPAGPLADDGHPMVDLQAEGERLGRGEGLPADEDAGGDLRQPLAAHLHYEGTANTWVYFQYYASNVEVDDGEGGMWNYQSIGIWSGSSGVIDTFVTGPIDGSYRWVEVTATELLEGSNTSQFTNVFVFSLGGGGGGLP
jgi:hypothetical protein